MNHGETREWHRNTSTIVHVASYAAPYGGNFLASLNVLDRLCLKNGLRQVFVFPQGAGHREWCARFREDGQTVYFLPDGGPIFRCALRLEKIIASEASVIVHTHFVQYDVAAWLASLLARGKGRKTSVIWHLHSDFPIAMTPARRLKDRIKHRGMGRSARMILVSEHLREQIRERGFPPGRTSVVPNGIDLNRTRETGRSAEEVLLDLGVTRNDRIILLFGWEPLTKGVDTALEAVKKLASEGCKVVLVLVGMEKLREYVRIRIGAQLPPWLRVASPAEHVADFFQVSSIFVCASRSEGLSFSVCEAMASGVPVIVSDIPGLRWVRASHGWVGFPPGDFSALAERIKSVLGWTPEERERMTSANVALACGTYNAERWAEGILRIYQDVIGEAHH